VGVTFGAISDQSSEGKLSSSEIESSRGKSSSKAAGTPNYS
jgi:hypothetical protein